MAFKTRSGYRITFTVDEESYMIIENLSKEMGLSDNQVSKFLVVKQLKQLTVESSSDDKNVSAAVPVIVKNPVNNSINTARRNKKKKR